MVWKKLRIFSLWGAILKIFVGGSLIKCLNFSENKYKHPTTIFETCINFWKSTSWSLWTSCKGFWKLQNAILRGSGVKIMFWKKIADFFILRCDIENIRRREFERCLNFFEIKYRYPTTIFDTCINFWKSISWSLWTPFRGFLFWESLMWKSWFEKRYGFFYFEMRY